MDYENWLNTMNNWIKEDLEMLCGESEIEDGVHRAMAYDLGVSRAAAIIEAAIEGLPNGDDAPYPVVHFSITLAKDIAAEHFAAVAGVLNDLNVVIQSGDYPSFGNFCLYKPLNQVFYGYRIPVNTAAIEAERENLRFFLATVFEQLDMFVDLILFVSDGKETLTIDKYMEYIKKIDDFNNIDERIEQVNEMLEKLEKELDDAK